MIMSRELKQFDNGASSVCTLAIIVGTYLVVCGVLFDESEPASGLTAQAWAGIGLFFFGVITLIAVSVASYRSKE